MEHYRICILLAKDSGRSSGLFRFRNIKLFYLQLEVPATENLLALIRLCPGRGLTRNVVLTLGIMAQAYIWIL